MAEITGVAQKVKSLCQQDVNSLENTYYELDGNIEKMHALLSEFGPEFAEEKKALELIKKAFSQLDAYGAVL